MAARPRFLSVVSGEQSCRSACSQMTLGTAGDLRGNYYFSDSNVFPKHEGIS